MTRTSMKWDFRIAAATATAAGRTLIVTRRSFLICALCSLAMATAGGWATADPPTPVHLTEADNIVSVTPSVSSTEIVSAGIFEGTIGSTPVSGTTLMHVRVDGMTFHCTHTWTASDGSSVLVIHSDCSEVTMNGEWFVVSDSGIFANLFTFGEGSLYMALFPPGGFPLGGTTWQVAEILTGSVH